MAWLENYEKMCIEESLKYGAHTKCLIKGRFNNASWGFELTVTRSRYNYTQASLWSFIKTI